MFLDVAGLEIEGKFYTARLRKNSLQQTVGRVARVATKSPSRKKRLSVAQKGEDQDPAQKGEDVVELEMEGEFCTARLQNSL